MTGARTGELELQVSCGAVNEMTEDAALRGLGLLARWALRRAQKRHQGVEGEVGKVGVPISTIADMEALFDRIPLDEVSVSMTINATAPIVLAFYIAVARRRGIAPDALRGTIQNDILKEYIARGTYIYPPKPSMRLVTDVFQYSSTEVPRWNTISISGYHMSEAGATAAQELAFTFSNAIAYVQAALDSGMNIDVV